MLKYSGNTTNMRTCIWISFIVVFQSLEAETNAHASISSGQMTLSQNIQLGQPYLNLRQGEKKNNESIVYYISRDMQPLSTIDDNGFRRLLQTLEPTCRYEPPTRKTITQTYLTKLYSKTQDKVQQQFKNAKYFSFTTDMWTSLSNQSYMSVTAHFIDNSFQLVSTLLGFEYSS